MNFKRLTAMLLALCMVLCMIPATQINAVSESDYTYTVSDGKATITAYSGAGGDITIPSALGGYPVTEIGDFAFSYNGNLTSVQIPAGVTRIGQFAFIVCTNLASVTIPEGVTTIGMQAFGSCTGLQTVSIPASVTEMSEIAFASCLSLKSFSVDANNPNYCNDASGALLDKAQKKLIQLPSGIEGSYTIADTVSVICSNAIFKCDNLTALNVSQDHAVYTSVDGVLYNKDKTTLIKAPGAFTGAYTIPSGVTTISANAFQYCGKLTAVTIPDTATTLGFAAFCGCTSLTTVVLPEGVTAIPDSGFAECTNLQSLTIPSSVTSIGYSAFVMCSQLTDIYYLGTQEQWEQVAIADYNDELQNMTIHFTADTDEPEVPEDTSGSCGEDASWELDEAGTVTITGTGTVDDAIASNPNVVEVVVSEGVTAIGTNAFFGCENLKSVVLPDTVTTIGNGAFAGCSSLETIVIPETVTTVGAEAFVGCSSLSEAIIGKYTDVNPGARSSDVVNTQIEGAAFAGCTSLTEVTLGNSVTSIGEMAFYGCDNLQQVTYCGTEAQWNAMSIGANNAALTDATRQYHDYVDGVCTVCGSAEETTTLTYTYTVTDGKATITGYEGVLSGEIVLPSTLDGYPVTAIGDTSFYYCSDLTSVEIPEGVITIADYAFRNCHSLASVKIPASVTTIGDSTFSCCSSLTSVEIPEGVITIGSYAFDDCQSLTTVTLGSGVTAIGEGAFNATGLTNVTYCGTEAQWNAISIGTNNAVLTDAQRQYHNYVDGVCTVCGAVREPAHIHAYSYSDNGDGTHTASCACEEEYTEPHSYADGACTGCGVAEHSHSFSFADNGDGTHTASCTCGDHYVEPHGFENGACFRCGVAEDHAHTWEDGACSGCGQSLAEAMDLSGDGKVTAFDAQILAEADAGLRELTGEQREALGELTAADILSYVLGTFGTNT